MKKIYLLFQLLFLLIVGITLTNCEKDVDLISVTSVTLDSTSITLVEGDSQTLTATISPSNAENQMVLWISSDASVATVKDGVVTAVKPGAATITVKSDDGGKTATCNVTVVARVYPVEKITLDVTSATIYEGESLTLTATITPNNATNKNVSWKSSNTSVATVVDGTVSALKTGTTTITVTTEDGDKTATCNVTVKAKVASVSLDKTEIALTEGDTYTLTATINPDNAANKNVSWKSSNTSVATVSNGKVTALKAGTATITVTTEEGGKTATCNVTVNEKIYPVENVSLDKTSAILFEGETLTLSATITPGNATNKNVTWKSSDTSVAMVADGKVTALKAGTTTITVTTEDEGKTATCAITVKAKVLSVSLDKTEIELTEGDTYILTATINPSNATNRNVTWNSNDTSVATVSNGKVTALKAGVATITVTTEDGGKMASCKVVVSEKVYSVTGISLNKSIATLYEGEYLTLIETIIPSNATNKSVSWTSSNTSVATVSNGKVTALKAGTATITVTTEDGGKTASCNITVLTPVQSVVLDKTSMILAEGETTTLIATINPSNASNKNVSWSSSNTSVATVSNGKVTALKAGTATITATTEDGGKTATCSVTVNEKIYPVESISLDKTTATLYESETATLIATINPSNATNKNVSWSSSNTSVATVSNGKVTALKAGTATITATTEDGGKTATCNVTVKAKVKSISLDKTTATLYEGETTTLIATINPSNASNKNVSWSSSNTSVATVSNGKVTALKAGTATITATTEDGGKTATCNVTVKAKVESVSLDRTSLTLTEGNTYSLIAIITPSNAANKNVIWSSNNKSVATVVDGKVTALKAGTAAITVTTEDGGKTATCDVTVVAKVYPVTSVSLNKSSITLKDGETITLVAIITPSNATNKNVQWSSYDPSIATVSNGVVTAIKSGSTYIQVATVDGNYIAFCQVTVYNPVTGISINKTSTTLSVGEKITLTAVIKPSNATNKNITWNSSNTNVAVVKDGEVEALTIGSTTITVTTEDGGKTATCDVIVNQINSNNSDLDLTTGSGNI